MTAARPLLLAPDMEYPRANPPWGAHRLAWYAWHAYQRFAPHVRREIRRGGAGSQLVADAFAAYDRSVSRPVRPLSRRDRLRAFDELLRIESEIGGVL